MNIDLEALNETKKVCHQELDIIVSKYNTSHLQLLYRYIVKEFKRQFLFAIGGMVLVCILSSLMIEVSMTCVVVYFMVLGSMAILEHMKNDVYQMKELVGVSYIQEGRGFLYRSIVIGGFQLIMFVCLCCLLPFDKTLLIQAILYALLPVYISQMICLSFIKYISHVFSVLASYLSLYLMMLFCLEYFSIVDYLNLTTCFVFITIIFIAYIINTAFIYKKRKENDVVWNWY